MPYLACGPPSVEAGYMVSEKDGAPKTALACATDTAGRAGRLLNLARRTSRLVAALHVLAALGLTGCTPQGLDAADARSSRETPDKPLEMPRVVQEVVKYQGTAEVHGSVLRVEVLASIRCSKLAADGSPISWSSCGTVRAAGARVEIVTVDDARHTLGSLGPDGAGEWDLRDVGFEVTDSLTETPTLAILVDGEDAGSIDLTGTPIHESWREALKPVPSIEEATEDDGQFEEHVARAADAWLAERNTRRDDQTVDLSALQSRAPEEAKRWLVKGVAALKHITRSRQAVTPTEALDLFRLFTLLAVQWCTLEIMPGDANEALREWDALSARLVNALPYVPRSYSSNRHDCVGPQVDALLGGLRLKFQTARDSVQHPYSPSEQQAPEASTNNCLVPWSEDLMARRMAADAAKSRGKRGLSCEDLPQFNNTSTTMWTDPLFVRELGTTQKQATAINLLIALYGANAMPEAIQQTLRDSSFFDPMTPRP